MEDSAPSVPVVLPEVVDQVALARLYGEPLFALPQ
ncbi:MAG: segregation/condensation protein A, partial [Betaproteobacteria bacterium]|nr:segregation/condensation protein A [Betaproteobacteria bacterium]